MPAFFSSLRCCEIVACARPNSPTKSPQIQVFATIIRWRIAILAGCAIALSRLANWFCSAVKNSDLVKLVELVSAVNTCAGGGTAYDTQVSVSYTSPQLVTYPINSFHSYSLSILAGSIMYQGFTLQAGTVRNVEFTTLNTTPLVFEINPSSEVLFEYLIETV